MHLRDDGPWKATTYVLYVLCVYCVLSRSSRSPRQAAFFYSLVIPHSHAQIILAS